MNKQNIDQSDFTKQYTTSMYFVITTLSTCGFGDISASKHDKIESLVMTILMFIGMLFYSYTIMKI